MPAIVVCAACQTKLKVPETSTGKALRCPKCKGIVPAAVAEPAQKPPPPKPKAPPPKEEEFEVNEPVEQEEEELEFNEAADEDEELEANEAVDEEETNRDEDSALVELGFAKGTNPFKQAKIADDVRKAVEKAFTKTEKALWAGRPSVKIIESKAWIGLIVGPICVLIGLSMCLVTGYVSAFVIGETFGKVAVASIGAVFGFVFSLVGLLAVIFRKGIGGNAAACYIVTNKRAYIIDTRAGGQLRSFSPQQLDKLRVEESTKFEGAGDLIFAYDFMGDPGVQVDKESTDRFRGAGGGSVAVGFLNIENVQLVRTMLHEVLIDPAAERAKEKKKKDKEKKRFKPFG